MPELVASTPIDNSLRRRTILRNALGAENAANGTLSPLRRGSLAGAASVNTSVSETADDNEERQRHRNVVDIQRRLSNVAKSPSSGGGNDSVRFAGDQEIKEHLQTCAKLYNENKINANNAWRLKIIDALRQLSRTDTGDNSATLQMASKSLDISTRVYSVRVDDAHADGMRLAGNIARMAAKERGGNDDDGAPDAEGDDDDGAKSKKKTRNKKRKRFLVGGEKKTVAKDAAVNLDDLPMLESVLFSARTKPEATAVDNLFTNILKTDNTGTMFEILGDNQYWCDETTPDSTVQRVKNVPAVKIDLGDSQLCPILLRDFYLDEWDPEEETLRNGDGSQLTQPSLTVDKDLAFDEQGLPIPELDGSVHDIFADNNIELDEDIVDDDINIDNNNALNNKTGSTQVDLVFAHGQMLKNPTGSCIQSFQTLGGANSLEYSYNPLMVTQSGKVIEQIWAGPSHWKLKSIRQVAPRRFTGQRPDNDLIKKRCARKRAAIEMIDFVDDDDEDKENLNNDSLNNKFKTIGVKLNAFVLKDRIINLPVLEKSLHQWESDLNKLQMADHAELRLKSNSNEQERSCGDDNDNYELGDYNYSNCNDSMYCPENNEAEDEDLEMGVDKNAAAAAAAVEFVGENLVDAPDLVAKTTIHFATQAKKMDMKKLKSAAWCLMTGSKNLEDNTKTASDIEPINFSALYRSLPKLITAKMRQSLSVHLAFLAVLHITNEHNLRLVQDKQRCQWRDFKIQQPDGA